MNDYPELHAVAKSIGRHLTAASLHHVVELSQDEPWIYTVAALDDDGYINSGIIGWSDKEKVLYFYGLDTSQANHDEREGVPEEDSKCWWDAKDEKGFLHFLKGDVRRVMKKFQKFMQDSA